MYEYNIFFYRVVFLTLTAALSGVESYTYCYKICPFSGPQRSCNNHRLHCDATSPNTHVLFAFPEESTTNRLNWEDHEKGWTVVSDGPDVYGVVRNVKDGITSVTDVFKTSLINDNVQYMDFDITTIGANGDLFDNGYTNIPTIARLSRTRRFGRKPTLPRSTSVIGPGSRIRVSSIGTIYNRGLDISITPPHYEVFNLPLVLNRNEVFVSRGTVETVVAANYHRPDGRVFTAPQLPWSILTSKEPGNCYRAYEHGTWDMTPMCLHHNEQFMFKVSRDEKKLIYFGFPEDEPHSIAHRNGVPYGGVKTTTDSRMTKRYCFFRDDTWEDDGTIPNEFKIPIEKTKLITDLCENVIVDLMVTVKPGVKHNTAPAIKTIRTLIDGWDITPMLKINVNQAGLTTEIHNVYSEIFREFNIPLKLIANFGLNVVTELPQELSELTDLLAPLKVTPMFQFYLRWMDMLWLYPMMQETTLKLAIEYGIYVPADEMVLGERMRRLGDLFSKSYTGSCPGAWESETRSARIWSAGTTAQMDPRKDDVIEPGAWVTTAGPRATGLREWIGGDTTMILGLHTGAIQYSAPIRPNPVAGVPEAEITEIQRMNRFRVHRDVYMGNTQSGDICDKNITECCVHKLTDNTFVNYATDREITKYMVSVNKWGFNHLSFGYVNDIYASYSAFQFFRLLQNSVNTRPMSIFYLNYPLDHQHLVECSGIYMYKAGMFLKKIAPGDVNTRGFQRVEGNTEVLVGLYTPDLCRSQIGELEFVKDTGNPPFGYDPSDVIDADTMDFLVVETGFEFITNRLLFIRNGEINLYQRLVFIPHVDLSRESSVYPRVANLPDYEYSGGGLTIPTGYSMMPSVQTENYVLVTVPSQVTDDLLLKLETKCTCDGCAASCVATVAITNTHKVFMDGFSGSFWGGIGGVLGDSGGYSSLVPARFEERKPVGRGLEVTLEDIDVPTTGNPTELAEWLERMALSVTSTTGAIRMLRNCLVDRSRCSVLQAGRDQLGEGGFYEIAQTPTFALVSTHGWTDMTATAGHKKISNVNVFAERRPCLFAKLTSMNEADDRFCFNSINTCGVECSCSYSVCNRGFGTAEIMSPIGSIRAPLPPPDASDIFIKPSDVVVDGLDTILGDLETVDDLSALHAKIPHVHSAYNETEKFFPIYCQIKDSVFKFYHNSISYPECIFGGGVGIAIFVVSISFIVIATKISKKNTQ